MLLRPAVHRHTTTANFSQGGLKWGETVKFSTIRWPTVVYFEKKSTESNPTFQWQPLSDPFALLLSAHTYPQKKPKRILVQILLSQDPIVFQLFWGSGLWWKTIPFSQRKTVSLRGKKRYKRFCNKTLPSLETRQLTWVLGPCPSQLPWGINVLFTIRIIIIRTKYLG